MATRAVLTLLDALLAAHERGPSGNGLEVVPVLVDDLAVHSPLVESALRHAGAAFLPTSRPDEPMQHRYRGDLASLVRTVIVLPRPGAGQAVAEVSELGDGISVDVLEKGAKVAEETPGLQALVDTLGLLFAVELDSVDMAVIAYDEDAMDLDVRRVLWELFTQHLPGWPLGRLRTLLVLVGTSRVEPDRHCQRGPAVSAQYRVLGRRCEARKVWSADVNEVRQLAERETSCHVLFLGAGFSASSKLPLGNELRDLALSRLVGTGKEPPEVLAGFFYTYVEQNGQLLGQEAAMSRQQFVAALTLERVLREELRRHSPETSPTLEYFRRRNAEAVQAMGPSPRHLRHVIQSGRRLVIVTVNFDTLIEHENGDVRVFADDTQFEGCVAYLDEYLEHGGSVPVLKLHGTIEDPQTIIATVDRTAMGLPETRVDALTRLIDAARPIPWTYVGYSMRDLDLSPVLQRTSFAQGTEEAWVSPFPAATAESFADEHRKAHWAPWVGRAERRNYRERLISETSDIFFELLADHWS